MPALLDALEAARARLADSVPRSALVQVGWWENGAIRCTVTRNEPAFSRPVYVLRTEGGAS